MATAKTNRTNRADPIGELRAIGEYASLVASLPILLSTRRGDGQAVLVLPGLSGSDFSTRPLRRYLRWLGYQARPWELGRNRGPLPGLDEALLDRLQTVFDRSGRKVSLVGWSLGGVFARRLAQLRPALTRQVVTLGSPIAGEVSRQQLPVPATAIYSRSDAIVPWRLARELAGSRAENIEVDGSHLGLGINPVVLLAIADRLAQPEDGWQPFQARGPLAAFYPAPDRP